MTTQTFLTPLRRGVLLGTLVIALSACGGGNWGFPYRIDVQQGNWITAAQVEQLQVGMTREQVRFVLGTPTLQDIFYSDRWEYPYYFKPGYGDEELRTFTVWFENDQLVRWDGSRQPNRQPFERADSGAEGKDQDQGATQADGQDSPAPGGPAASPVFVDTPPMPNEADDPQNTQDPSAIPQAPQDQAPTGQEQPAESFPQPAGLERPDPQEHPAGQSAPMTRPAPDPTPAGVPAPPSVH